MDIDDITSVTVDPEEDRRVSRRQLIQQAITLAGQSRWQEAAEINKHLVEIVLDDAEAYNRLGKAYTELGRIADARAAYENSLRVDPANLIAQRNLERLSHINEREAADLAKRAGQKLDPQFFIEETGKTGVTALEDPGDPTTLATLTAGMQVAVTSQDAYLVVTTVDGAYVGRVTDRLAARLHRLMQSGNQYQAGVVGVDGRTVRVIIRETFQSPQNSGRISFPPQGKQEGLPRPYVREGLLRRSGDEEDEDEMDVDVDADSDEDDDDDSGEFGFHEANLDES